MGGDWKRAILSLLGSLVILLVGLWRDIRLWLWPLSVAGFDILETYSFTENVEVGDVVGFGEPRVFSGPKNGVLVRLRPRGTISEARMLVNFNAVAQIVRARLEGHGDGIKGLDARFLEKEIRDESIRSVEIPILGPPSINPGLNLVIELLGPEPIEIANIKRTDRALP